MKHRWKSLSEREKNAVFGACAVVLFWAAITHLGAIRRALGALAGFFLPVIIGFFIAHVLDPIAEYFSKTVFRRVRAERAGWICAVVLTFVLVFLVLALLIGGMAPQLVSSAVSLMGNIESYALQLQQLLQSKDIVSEDTVRRLAEMAAESSDLLSRAALWLTENFDRVRSASTSIGSGTVNLVISVILAIYFLVGKRRLRAGAGRLFRLMLDDGRYARWADMWRRFETMFSLYILCELLDALIVGTVNYLFMKLAGMPYAPLISAAVGITNLVPTFGPVVGAAFGAVILLLAEPILAVWFLLFTLVLQTVDGYIIKPKMFGNIMNVSPILILISIVVGGRMFGVAGMLLAIPAAATIEYLYRAMLLPGLERRRQAKTAPAKHGAENE